MALKYGLIDIGSNTMRAVVYQINPDNSFKIVVNEKEFAEILSYIEDGVLTQEGIMRLCSVLKRMKSMCDSTECDGFSCFATASLRSISNQTQVLVDVKKATGIDIRLLSGCEEAYYDYIGLQSCISDEQAVGFDLGGGSAQVFYYDDYGLVTSTSQEIGALAMYNKFVKGLFPNSKQRAKITKYVQEQLEGTIDFSKKDFTRIYGMGGTARALAKVHKHILGRDGETRGYTMTLEEIEELDRAISMLGMDGIKILNRVIPERLVTFVPGLLVIKGIMNFVGAKELSIVVNGVRDGYVIENGILRGSGIDDFRDEQESLCK